MKSILLTGFLLGGFFLCQTIPGQDLETPAIGAQVYIEPGQTPQQIDNWFFLLKENKMTICRIRLFESYIKKPDGSWDFTLFDIAFKAAEKYDIKILATLFPSTEKTDISGLKFPRDDRHLEEIAEYIQQTVTHFKDYRSLYGWVLLNEPGTGSVPVNQFAQQKLNDWKKENPSKEYTVEGFPMMMDLTGYHFLMDYNTWYLNWIAQEIDKYDPGRHLHVNNHSIFDLASEYNFPEWRKFLSSLGGSAHASWHFGYFNRSQYAVAMSANCEILRSGAGSLPWMMTEIQGGNNTYSGTAPFCPSAEEISQWLWIILGTEAKGAVFWTLNPRATGFESGEWSMLTFQNQASDRLLAAKKVAETIRQNTGLFSEAKIVNSGINILYIRESLWAERIMASPSVPEYEGRNVGAVMKSALAYFEALSEMGINCNFKEIGEFDFNREDYSGQTIILANQLSVPLTYTGDLELFVSKGGTLIVDGLTAYFDENLHNTMQGDFHLENLFGGNISEFRLVDNIFDLELGSFQIPAHLWKGAIYNLQGSAESVKGDQIYATSHYFGEGQVLWIPSLLGLGGRILKDYQPLCQWLEQQIPLNDLPMRFDRQIKGMFMKTMESGNKLISVIINKSDDLKEITILTHNTNLKPRILFANKGGQITDNASFEIHSEETLVVEWNLNHQVGLFKNTISYEPL